MEILNVSQATHSSNALWCINTAQIALNKPLQIEIPSICRKRYRSSHIYCTYNEFSKPISGPRSSRKTSVCQVADSGASLARPFEENAQQDYNSGDEGNLLDNGRELQNTVRLVECAMFSAIAGLAYFLSNLLRVENYFGCFFPLPLVISSMRWGVAAGRKTMVATAMLLLILSGPLKAASYLITINAHASVSYMLAAVGINMVPSMGFIYLVFATLLLVNCGSFVFLLHVLYAIFLRRLGIKTSMSLPGWLERAM